MKYRNEDERYSKYNNVFDFSHEGTVPEPQTYATQNNTTSDIDRFITGCSLFIIVACMFFWSGYIIATTIVNGGDAGDIVTAVVSQVAFWFIAWVVYYLGWKYYWIVLAIGWLLLTFYALFLANNLLNIHFLVV
jgi:hypothetical protein